MQYVAWREKLQAGFHAKKANYLTYICGRERGGDHHDGVQHSLYVSNLSYRTQTPDLEDAFAEFGKVCLVFFDIV